MKTFISALIVMGSILQASDGQPLSRIWEDISYTGDTSVSQRLDIYLPETHQNSYPAVIIIYGSAFFGNNLKKAAIR